jgi:hypothetical protein
MSIPDVKKKNSSSSVGAGMFLSRLVAEDASCVAIERGV